MTMVIRGMYGMGDCLHQRAILRTALKMDDVVLETFYWSMYEDLLSNDGFSLQLRLLAGIEPRIRDRKQTQLFLNSRKPMPRGVRPPVKLTYCRDTILRNGSILAAQYASIGLKMPERPDFSLSVPEDWRSAAQHRISAALRVNGSHRGDRPLLVMRPSVLNDVWLSESRSPDKKSYAHLYEFIRDEFFVVTVANIGNKGECFDGEKPDADVEFLHGELRFEELAGLFAEADFTFTCPGFAPVLSQTVGTPTIIVYGGNESYRTTNSVGAHLAPTLAIQPDRPCECHLKNHNCDKTIDLEKAIDKIAEFMLCEH